jgi:hypothetical protein
LAWRLASDYPNLKVPCPVVLAVTVDVVDVFVRVEFSTEVLLHDDAVLALVADAAVAVAVGPSFAERRLRFDRLCFSKVSGLDPSAVRTA